MKKPKRRRVGRPSRAEASATALAGVDLATVDPVAVLKTIAADTSAPASARVSAARALISLKDEPEERTADDAPVDALTRRALALMARRAN